GAIGTAVLAVVLQRATASHPHTLAGHAHAFDISYWWGLGMAALSLIPCLMLLRAERDPGGDQGSSADAEAMAEALVA
ncbi:MAG: hypothetical protein ACRDK2_16990, partial [Solirubrobacteraceae bacterium]